MAAVVAAGAGLFVHLAEASQRSRYSSSRARQLRRLDRFQQRHDKLRRSFADDLKDVANYCEKNGLQQEAKDVRAFAADVVEASKRVAKLPEKVRPDIPRYRLQARRDYRLKFRKAREDYANGLYKLARDVLNAGFPSFAYQLVRETALHNSDHVAARRMLGYVRYKNRWVTPFEKRKLIQGEVWHDKYGWRPKSHVAKYENGLQYYVPRGARRGTWKPAAVVAQLRRDFDKNPWQIRTEHFLVKTNHSLEAGVRVASLLEEFYHYFFQTFAGFFNSRQQMQKLFAGTQVANRRPPKPYVVHYYRNKQEYVDRLKQYIPQIGITNGLYLFSQRVCHFFHSPNEDNTSTLYHEATHQIFYESIRRNRLVAKKEHFWIVEGISCYMESFQSKDGTVSLGHPRHPRFVAAKYRYVNEDFYVPLKEFTQMGMQTFQTHKNIRKNYSQASGLTKFFMEYDGGKYREALIEHLSQIYRANPRSRVPSLDELTGVSYAELDRQYGEFISSLPVRIPRQ